MKPYNYYTSFTVDFPDKFNYTLKYYYRKGKLMCIKKPFCDLKEIPINAVEETVFDEDGFKLHEKAWLSEKIKLEEEFKEDLIREEGLSPSEKVDICFSLAWDYGCSQGLKEVHDYFRELSQLVK